MAMKFNKINAREVSLGVSVKFVAFSNTTGVYSDVLVWEHTNTGEWTPLAWRTSSAFAGEVSSDDLELELLTREDGAVLLGSDCTRQQFYEYVFGTDAFKDSAFQNPEELGFESDVWLPAQIEAPDSLMSDHDYLVDYHESLDWEQAEAEVREALERLDEYVHEELYGSSYKL